MRSARRSSFTSNQDGRHQEGSEMLPEIRTPAPRSLSSMELFVSSAESLLQRAVTHRQPWRAGSRRWRRRFKDPCLYNLKRGSRQPGQEAPQRRYIKNAAGIKWQISFSAIVCIETYSYIKRKYMNRSKTKRFDALQMLQLNAVKK